MDGKTPARLYLHHRPKEDIMTPIFDQLIATYRDAGDFPFLVDADD
ncbi:hypothetical protein [Rhodococcus qingshengii]|nr:hypothetical protein [Rhodococcus qingshengii]